MNSISKTFLGVYILKNQFLANQQNIYVWNKIIFIYMRCFASFFIIIKLFK